MRLPRIRAASPLPSDRKRSAIWRRSLTSSFSRLARRSLALRPAHSRGHQFVTRYPKASAMRYLHDSSGCFRLERLPGGTCTHWRAPPCHGAHPKQTFTSSLRASCGSLAAILPTEPESRLWCSSCANQVPNLNARFDLYILAEAQPPDLH